MRSRDSEPRRGMLLMEQVLCVGLLAVVLLMAAAGTIQSGRGSRSAQRGYEAQTIAQNLLETNQARAVSLLPIGTMPALQGTLSDNTPYTARIEVYGLGGTGSARGLTDNDVKGLRVRVAWRDDHGEHEARCESLLARVPR